MTDTDAPRTDIRDTNRGVIDQYRAGGASSQQALILLTTTGAKTGKEHTTPVCTQRDGDRFIVAGSMGGLSKHPQWYRNLVAHPELTVEYLGDVFRARATTLPNGPERDALFARMAEVIPGLYEYQDKCRDRRQIPIIALEVVDEDS